MRVSSLSGVTAETGVISTCEPICELTCAGVCWIVPMVNESRVGADSFQISDLECLENVLCYVLVLSISLAVGW